MIQDISPHKYNNTFYSKMPCNSDYVLIFENEDVVLKKNEIDKSLPTYGEIKEILDLDIDKLLYLFSIDDHGFYLIFDEKINNIDKFYKENINIFRELQPQWISFGGITGYHLYNWYNENRYCGKCGELMSHSTKERALICDKCNNIKYPQISPAIIVGIMDGDKILMTKYSRGDYKKYALIAGFMEIGETLEDTVRREVMEEVGLKVKNIRYYKNQPWAFSSSLLVGFFADLDGDSLFCIDEEELSEAVWFDRKDIPKTESDISLTNEMIEAFRNNQI